MAAVLALMDREQMQVLHGDTGIFIYPGYTFRVCKGLITNFHQPKSTLVMLISAFMGEDWRKLYEEALAMDYRFLSYGDSCLLLP
jgi:S-adenosylmethionine:tRNA ribosyltransferase-isomerase